MTNYFATNYAKNWKLARSRHCDASVDATIGNLSFHVDASNNKKDSSSTRRVSMDTDYYLPKDFLPW